MVVTSVRSHLVTERKHLNHTAEFGIQWNLAQSILPQKLGQ